MNLRHARVYSKLSEFLGKCRHQDVNYQIAKCCIEKIDEFPDITLDEIAFLAHTTAPTVTKFVKRLGYASFKAFRYDIQPYSSNHIALISHDVDNFLAKDAKDTKNFFQAIDLNKLTECLQDILQYETIVILNSSYSLPFSHYLRFLFERLNKKVYVLHRQSDPMMIEALVQNNGMILMISLSGQWLQAREATFSLNAPYYLVSANPKANHPCLPWVDMEILFQSYYTSNRYLSLLGKAIEICLDQMY